MTRAIVAMEASSFGDLVTHTSQEEPALRLMNLLVGYWGTQAIYVAAHTRLADELIAGPRTAEEIAAATGCDPTAMGRVLRYLASIGVLTAGTEGQYGSKGVTELLE